MRLYLICVRDRALAAFGRPFAVPSLGVAIRAFGDMVSGQDAEMAKHPDDYDLYHVGYFDEESGGVEALIPVQIGIGKQLVVKRGEG